MRVLAPIITILGTIAGIAGSVWGATKMNRAAWGRGVQDAKPETPLRKFWRYTLNGVAAVLVLLTLVVLVLVTIKITVEVLDL